MSYTIPEMEWPVMTKTKNPVLLSEKYGTTNGRWYIPIEDEEAWMAIRTLLASYKVPIYHLTIDEITNMGQARGVKHRVQYIESRYVYVWTFSAPKTPVVHIYHMGGDRDENLTCSYEKTVDASLLTNEIYECKEIVQRMREL